MESVFFLFIQKTELKSLTLSPYYRIISQKRLLFGY